jgi:hypothetical protein
MRSLTRSTDRRTPRHGRPRAIQCVFLVAATLAVGCGGRKSSSDTPEPIPECQEYDRAFAACMLRDAGVSEQATALATSTAERSRLKELCVTNLKRIRQACL